MNKRSRDSSVVGDAVLCYPPNPALVSSNGQSIPCAIRSAVAIDLNPPADVDIDDEEDEVESDDGDAEGDISDGDVDPSELEALLLNDDQVDAKGILRAAALGRINDHTREAYDLHMRHCALWAQTSAQFKQEVIGDGADLRLKWPLNEDIVVGFIDYLQQKQVPWIHKTGKMKNLAPSSLAHVFSAFRDLYSVHGEAMSHSLDKFFANTYRKYTLFISQQKLEGRYPDHINSAGFSLTMYETICEQLSRYWTFGKGSCGTAVSQIRLFLIFCFALLGRGERVGRLRYQWISWCDDCLLIKIPTSKSDQSGALSYFKRVYANALKPWVCPILALAIEVFSRTGSITDFDRVFRGANVHVRHAIKFRKFLFKKFGDSGLGIVTRRITNHSAKRSGIMAVSEAEVVQWHSAELRADHKCGVTSNYQTSPAPQQDGIMGRILSCLSFGETEFNIAPPHFEAKDIAHISFGNIVPQFELYGLEFQTVIPFLFASLIFHWDWIEATIPRSHPIFASKFVVLHKDMISDLKPKIFGGRTGSVSHLKVTGNSYLSDMHNMCKRTAGKVDDIYTLLQSNAVSGASADAIIQNEALHALNASVQILIKQNTQMMNMQQTVATIPTSHVIGLHQRPVFYLNRCFRLENGIRTEGLFYKWYTPDGNIPAYKDIRNSMLPDGESRRSQESLLSRFRSLMEFMSGTTPHHFMTRDLPAAFHLCWARLKRVCSLSDATVGDAAITVYGKVPKARRSELRDKPVPGFNSNSFVSAAVYAMHAAAAAVEHAQNATSCVSTDAIMDVAAQANAFMQSASTALETELGSDLNDGFMLTESGSAAAPVESDWPKCVPRGALMFPREAPRPSESAAAPHSTSSATALRGHAAYSAYLQSHAPRTGAQACWACPYCLSSTSRGAFQANAHCLRRHVREQHTSNYDASAIGAYLDRSPLLWCTKTQGRWQPVFGDDVMRVVSSYTRVANK